MFNDREKRIIHDLIKDELRCLQAVLDEQVYESEEEKEELERDLVVYDKLLKKVEQ